MTSVEFERMLSARPKVTSMAGQLQEAPCLRDMVFDYYYGKYPNNDERVQFFLKSHTDSLFKLLVK